MALIQIDTRPGDRALRWFAGLWLPLFCGAVGAIAWRVGGTTRPLVIALAVAAVGAVVGLLAPRLIRPVFVGLSVLTFPIGWVVSHALLAVIYYVVLTVTGVVLRLFRADPMTRAFDRDAATYWTELPRSRDRSRYFRQF